MYHVHMCQILFHRHYRSRYYVHTASRAMHNVFCLMHDCIVYYVRCGTYFGSLIMHYVLCIMKDVVCTFFFFYVPTFHIVYVCCVAACLS